MMPPADLVTQRAELLRRHPKGDKPCPKCGEWKPLAAFPPNRKTLDGLSSWCRVCHVAATREWRARRSARAD
jgi:hypothetical protein